MTARPCPRHQGPRHLCLRADGADDELVVRDATGAPRGLVRAVVLDLSAGRAAYAIVGGGGLLDAHRPVPWSVLERGDAAGFLLAIDDEAWRRAPTLPPEAAIDWNDEAVHRRIWSFYDRRPGDGAGTDTAAVTDREHEVADDG